MLKGTDYLESDEKRAFDKHVAAVLRPIPLIAKLGARATFGYEPYEDWRVGQYGKQYPTTKIKTLSDETGEPLNAAARLFRIIGTDETLQFEEIAKGTLSVIGRRRLVPDEYDRLRDIAQKSVNGRSLLGEWDDVVLPYPCGLLSSYGLEGRELGSESVERRLQLDVADSHNASRNHDIALIASTVRKLLGGKIRHSSLPIEEL